MSIISPKLLKLLEVLKKPSSENNIPYMYVDTVGKVTVGVGHNLDAHKDMLSLAFIVKRLTRYPVKGGDSGVAILSNKVLDRVATKDEIQNDYDFIKKHKGLGKYNPENLRKYTTLELSVETVNTVFKKDLNIAVAIAKREFGVAFNTYPVTCQAALVDIAFNVGNFSSFRGTFIPAIKGTGKYASLSMEERWEIASKNCRRGQISGERNRHVARWLMEGAKAVTV